ncbi:hypothetical protein [Burkholderia singularis]|uniref:hypothetical protein n=1 Tax=Burkholderia singularis TaxID=1503053 RepID=UPI000F7A3931|nr:hypothetical protein [Burkholderia singularis]
MQPSLYPHKQLEQHACLASKAASFAPRHPHAGNEAQTGFTLVTTSIVGPAIKWADPEQERETMRTHAKGFACDMPAMAAYAKRK